MTARDFPVEMRKLRILHRKGVAGGPFDGSVGMSPVVRAVVFTGGPTGYCYRCAELLDDHQDLIETNDARLWICPE